MAKIEKLPQPATPVTHALVVGVSDYPSAKAGALGPLTTAARSASEVAAWLLDEHHDPDCPVASVRVLLSPAPGETIHPRVAAELAAIGGAPCPATRAALKAAVVGMRQDCDGRPDDRIIAYVAGHGVQPTGTDAVVLLHDVGDPDEASRLERAVRADDLRYAMAGTGFPGRQLWVVDACRVPPDFAHHYREVALPAALGDRHHGDQGTSTLVLATAEGQAAYATPGARTFLCEALLAGLRGEAARGRRSGFCPSWHVSDESLMAYLPGAVAAIAESHGEVQRVVVDRRGESSVIHRLTAPPMVPVEVRLRPSGAEAGATARLFVRSQAAAAVPVTTWPARWAVPGGIYALEVSTPAAYPDHDTDLLVEPVRCDEEIEL